MNHQLAAVPETVLREALALAERKQLLAEQTAAREHMMPFAHQVYGGFLEGAHHRQMAKVLEPIVKQRGRRVIVNMPPRHSKSEMASFLLPSWFLGQNPKLKIMQVMNTTDLATRFGRRVRDLLEDPLYQRLFPETRLKEDNKGAGNWSTTAGGEYYAAGVGAIITGRGADLLVIDDPHSEQDVNSPTAFKEAYEWYTSGPRQRLQPGASIVIVMTRWGEGDLTGQLLKKMLDGAGKGDQWEVIEFPAILPSGSPLWPEFWSLPELEAVRAELPVHKWEAQYQQRPTSDKSSIVGRGLWKPWEKEDVPNISYIIQAYDTAFSKKESADYSAITTWGIFHPVEGEEPHIILLGADKGRWSFPQLKRIAKKEHDYWQPDLTLVEAKATGRPLIDELSLHGITALPFSPGRRRGGGVDKHYRMNMVSPLFEAGRVWFPEGKRFAEEVIEEVAAFPRGEFDDYCDSMTLALMRFREGRFVDLPDDQTDPDEGEALLVHEREYY